MDYRDEDEEIECDIIESYGIFSSGIKNWNKEVNFVSWNGRPAKIDIRSWQRNHQRCGKGITITTEEAEELVKLLSKILMTKNEKMKSRTKPGQKSKKKLELPKTLEPFYDELELLFGAAPMECKTARNTLLKKYHPDRNAGNIAFATRKTIKIKEAYDRIISWWGENS
ncbi:MAG: hypothetical protein LBH42_09050 [Treponema sp.]|jgi:hypothetical protein|nr:hypothetical protein [Treponema sp.]